MNNLSRYKLFKRMDRVFDFVLKIFWFALLCKWLFAGLDLSSLFKW